MTTECQPAPTAGGLCDMESWKAFHQMYGQQGGTYGHEKYMLPFLQQFTPYTTTGTSSFSPTSSSSSNSSNSHQSSKKKPVPVPAEQKDEQYYERRKRNNEAARKSREQRRQQDSHNEVRVKQLEAENMHLRAYIQQLCLENAAMKQQFYQQTPGYNPTDPTTVPSFLS